MILFSTIIFTYLIRFCIYNIHSQLLIRLILFFLRILIKHFKFFIIIVLKNFKIANIELNIIYHLKIFLLVKVQSIIYFKK